MYNVFRSLCERLLRIPPDPEPPPGDEASTRIFRAAPNYYKYLLALWGITTFATLMPLIIIGLVITVSLAAAGKGGWVALALAAVIFFVALHILAALFHLAVVRLNFEKRWYIVTDRSLRVREGVTTVREMTVNFANIQNISVSQGPLQRILGIFDLRVDTAGGGGATSAHGHNISQNLHTAWFRGIENANQVRELIQDRLRHLKDSGLGDHEELRHAGSTPGIPVTSPDFIAALRSIHEEARALRLSLG
jgi:membrane protein YdbS with pleckstrin-like domain